MLLIQYIGMDQKLIFKMLVFIFMTPLIIQVVVRLLKPKLQMFHLH